MIAEAAYYIALNRDFCTDNQLDDWLQAEQEIIASEYHKKSLKKSFLRSMNDFQLPSFSIFPKQYAYGY